MGKLFFLFMICFLSSGGFLQGNEDRRQGNPDEIFCSCKKSFQKDQDGKTCINPDRLWVFNGQAYLLNDSEQWVPSGLKVSQGIHEFLIDLYRRGICPKGHQGIYLDQRIYEEGIWCCRGMFEGKKCPYHIDIQYPNGIPKGGN